MTLDLMDPGLPLGWLSVRQVFVAYLVKLLAQYTVFFGLAFPLLWMSGRPWVQRRKIQERLPRRRDLVRECSAAVSSMVVFATMVTATLVLARLGAFPLFHWQVGELAWAWYLVGFPLMVLVADVYSYAVHRLLHTRFLYRRVHYLHHQSTEPTPIAAISLHPVEAFLVIAILPVEMALLPLDPLLIGIFGLYFAWVGVRNELGFELQTPLFVRLGLHRLYGSSTFHNLHHQDPRVHFALATPIMDRLFGTLHPGFDALIRAKTGADPARNREAASC